MSTYLYFRTYWGKNSESGWSGRNVLAKNKMELVETCIKSLELADNQIHSCAYVDYSIDTYTTFLESMFNEVVHVSEGFDVNDHQGKWPIFGGMGSFSKLLDYIASKKHADNDIILILEDDYLFTSGGMKKWIGACAQLDGFVSPFDHPDRYIRTDDYFHRKTRICIVEDTHWKNIESNTGVVGGKYKYFKKTAFLRKIPRFHIWFFWPGRLLGRELPSIDRVFCRRAYIWLGIKLYSPMPGLATHLSYFVAPRNSKYLKKNQVLPETQLSPGVDWKKRFENVLSK